MMVRMDTGWSTDAPSRSAGWVARRLGVAPSTLRSWHRRYDVGPTGRSAGGHGRYRPQDLARLERMRRLVLAGVPTAEAARVSGDPGSVPAATSPGTSRRKPRRTAAPRRRDAQVRALTDAAVRLDQAAVEPLLAGALGRDGVVTTWDELVLPVLTDLGEHFARHGGYVEVEHLFTACVRTALVARIGARRGWDNGPPVLAACPDQEQHSLPLHALGAALADVGCPTRILGASVPVDALATATRLITPRAVFLWAHSPGTARSRDLPAAPRGRRVPVVVGGPGWRGRDLPPGVTRVESLSDAVAAAAAQLAAPAP